jgi:suppressor of ftsI
VVYSADMHRRARVPLCLLAVAAALLPKPAQPSGPELVPPRVLRSSNGRLTVDLEAAPGNHLLGGWRFDGMFYNRRYLPELWRVLPGDELVVRFRNRLPEMTNLHFHGLNVSPRNNGDNIFIHVLPGESFTYRVKIPADQHPGLFWYHPHAHGRTSPQIIAGLSGGLIVEGAGRFFPFLEQLPERVVLLKHIPDPTPDWKELVTLNGMLDPTIDIRSAEAQYWRIGNIGADLFLKLKIDGMPFFIVATDGHYLSRPRRMEEVMLGPGQRVEAVVVGGEPGPHAFRSESFTLEVGRPPLPERSLGVVVSRGPPADVAANQKRIEEQTVHTGRFIDEIRGSPIARRRTFTFSRTEDRQKFFINGLLFDEGRTDVTVMLGDVEEWTLRNEDNQLHNFHIHQTDFLVTEVNGSAVAMDSLRDTFTLPAANNGRASEVKVVIPFADPTILGRFVFHCHVVKHEDKGMMQTIEVRAR